MTWPFQYLNREWVVRLIELAAACRQCDGARLEDKNAWTIKPGTERGKQLDALITQGWSRERLRLLREIQRLSRDGVSQLAAMYWYGRGDATVDQVLQHAESAFSPTLYYYLAEKDNLGAGLLKALGRIDRDEASVALTDRNRPAA